MYFYQVSPLTAAEVIASFLIVGVLIICILKAERDISKPRKRKARA